MPLTQPPFRADHVGSLLRPPELTRARAEHKAGRLSSTDLRKAEDVAIREVVKLQEELGLQGITDGEFRRSSWHMDFLYQIGGVRKVQQNITVHFHSDKGDVDFTPSGLKVEGRLSLDGCIFGDHFDFLKSCHEPHAEAHDSFAQHDALPRWTRRDRRDRLSTHGGFLARSVGGVCARDRGAGAARLHLSAAR